MPAAEVVVEELTVLRVRPGRPPQAAVDALCLHVQPGERVALVGPNGAGKTTVLHAMVGALPFSGAVRYGGQALTPSTLAQLRRRVGLVFADPSEQFFLP